MYRKKDESGNWDDACSGVIGVRLAARDRQLIDMWAGALKCNRSQIIRAIFRGRIRLRAMQDGSIAGVYDSGWRPQGPAAARAAADEMDAALIGRDPLEAARMIQKAAAAKMVWPDDAFERCRAKIKTARRGKNAR